MLRILLELGIIYTIYRWTRTLCISVNAGYHWISNIALMAIITLVALGVVLPFGYEMELEKLVFEDVVSTAWLVVDTLEVSFFFMVCEYFERQIRRKSRADKK